jgi:hypothetical protein
VPRVAQARQRLRRGLLAGACPSPPDPSETSLDRSAPDRVLDQFGEPTFSFRAPVQMLGYAGKML